jgi:polyisoprenoid-binding protein YceI
MLRVAAALLVTGTLIGLSPPANAASWKLDPSHTTVGFSVTHLFTSVQGRFTEFDARIEFDPAAPEQAVVRGTVRATSINTDNEKRDKHLRSADFFDVDTFPALSFESTGLTAWTGQEGRLAGKLTIHGVTRPVEFEVRFLGRGRDPWGNERAGFRATLKIDRKDYGLNWNELLETGGVLVGDEVEIRIDAEGLLQE